MLFALAWWAILLWRKTNTIYELKSKIDSMYPDASDEYFRQNTMIVTEGLVFAIALIIGIIILNRALRREIAVAKHQKNFLLSVTHELKSPITAIQLILDTFKKRKLNEEQSSLLLDNGKEEAERLKKLVDDLLMAAQINPKSNLTLREIQLDQLLEVKVNDLQKINSGHRLTFYKEKGQYLLKSHLESLSLIISNILDNALKYSKKDTEISINLEPKDQYVILNIKDQGRGIPEKEKRNIFKQFYRIGDEDIRSSKGTGLGLYLVKELCKKLGIKISVKDNKPQGSIFKLVIPKNLTT